MPKFEWIEDPESGDLILKVDENVRARIPNWREIKFDAGKPGGSVYTLEDLKRACQKACEDDSQ